MGHLPDARLKTWKQGDALRAADLSRNFQVLADQVQTAVAIALTPDEATQAHKAVLQTHTERLDRIEAMLQLHARQRTEKEWAPLAHLGAVLVRLQQLQETVNDVAGRLEQALKKAQALHDGQERRLARLEQQPEPATLEDHRALAKSHADLKIKEHMLLAQIIALRSEVIALRGIAMGKDREANRLEFAPLSYIGAILARLQALEAKP